MPTDDRLDSLAGSVSDGGPVDWEGAESAAAGGGDEERSSLRALRDVARIVEFNRGLQRSLSPGGEPASNAGGPARWGELMLLEPVGSGASGEIWRAWDATLRREVALKFLQSPRAGAAGAEAAGAAGPGALSDDAVAADARLLDEARALAR